MNRTDTATETLAHSPWVYGDRFPSADMLHAAAALFPAEPRTQERGFAHVGRGIYPEAAREFAEGSWPELVIAPGMVTLRRRDRSAADRARTRAVERRQQEARHRSALIRQQTYAPMALALDDDEIARSLSSGVMRTRGSIARWSHRSQTRLIQAVLSLDLAPLVSGTRSPVMVTLTLPDKWLAVAPDAETIAAKFDDFRRKWAARWGAPQWVWKREFQLRGAPHFHVWTVPPVDDLDAFARELRRMWSESLDITDERDRILHAIHGVDVSRADGMRARDPRRLAFYFLKESGASERKAYQNEPPAAWRDHESVGRYWGVRGIRRAQVTVEISPEDFEALYDRLADIRAAATGWHRDGEGQLINVRTGVVMADPMGGWVAVPSGTDFAVELAALLVEPPS